MSRSFSGGVPEIPVFPLKDLPPFFYNATRASQKNGVVAIQRKLCYIALSAAILIAFGRMGRNLPVTPSASMPGFVKPTERAEKISCGQKELGLPFKLEENGLIVEKLLSYSGTYWEDGSDEDVTGVAALMICNPTDRMVEFAGIALEQDGGTECFFVYCLPPNSRCLVLEKSRAAYSPEPIKRCRGLVTRWGDMAPESQELTIAMTDWGVTVKNRTNHTYDHVAVYYKMYMPQGDFYLGGVCYSAHIHSLEPKHSKWRPVYHVPEGITKAVAVQTVKEENAYSQ